MRRMLVFAVALSGCTTTFYGSSKVTGGAAGCKSACDAWGMDLAGMVKMGEYSDGCICQVKPVLAPDRGAPPPGVPSGQAHAGGSVIPPATGVFMQMQAQAAAAAAAAAHQGAADSARAREMMHGHGR